MTNNNKTKAKIATLNIPIPIPIELVQFLSKKGQYIVPNNIVDQYAHVWPGVWKCDFKSHPMGSRPFGQICIPFKPTQRNHLKFATILKHA